jgi:hypothetical protein
MACPSRFCRGLVATLATVAFAASSLPVEAADIADSSLAMIPADAAFVSATLRGREQYDRIVKSKAFQALLKLPGVARAIDSLEEQKSQPGSPLSMIDVFMQMPENQQALEVLEDMVGTDTFVYGEPSWAKLLELMQKVQRAQQAANLLSMVQSLQGTTLRLEEAEVDEMDEDEDEANEDEDEEDADEDDGAAARRPIRARLARFQAVEADLGSLSSEELSTRMMIEAVADNIDLLVMPDTVWGFRITDKAAASTQLLRIEELLKTAAQTSPELADAVERKKIAGGEFVTFTFDPEIAAWRELFWNPEGLGGGLDDEIDAIAKKVDAIAVVFAIGIIDDHVIVSLGDSTAHLEKIGRSGAKNGLLGTKPLAVLLDHRDKPITGVNFASEALMAAVAPSAEGIEYMATLSDQIADLADLPAEAAVDARRELQAVAAEYRKWLPVAGPWLAFSFLSEQGYEGYAWDWSKNMPLDGSKRLDLLEHAGGAPLAVYVARGKSDVAQFDTVVSWARRGWEFFKKYRLPKLEDAAARERVTAIETHLFPLAERFVTAMRTKLLPALAGGQVGLVLDAKSKTKKLHRTLPEADAALPIIEPAIVFGLDDPKLFREGLSDLFALADELVDAVRELDPDAVPADYQVAEPEKAKVEGGTIWSWALEKSGIDDQVRPSIAVGEEAAVFSLVPKQAGRMIVESRLETGSQLSAFEEPLATAAALDVAGLIDALEPWVVYATRYGCVQQRDGSVDPEIALDAATENAEAREALVQAKTAFEALRSLRVGVAETRITPEATVTHWRNVIRDMK